MQQLLPEIEQRWADIFRALASGDDVPPGPRLRTEGLMEAAVLVGEASAEELSLRMDQRYRAAFGRGLSADFGEDWQAFFPFPQIPAMARRAPVYPSTPE